MSNNLELLNQIISLADFSTMDSILFHHRHFINICLLVYIIVNACLNEWKQVKNKSLKNLFVANIIVGVFCFWRIIFNDSLSIEERTNLNEQQIALLKTIDDSNVIQAINYNVARYGANLYSIDKALSDTYATLEEIEKEKVIIKEKQRLVNPPKFLELKTN